MHPNDSTHAQVSSALIPEAAASLVETFAVAVLVKRWYEAYGTDISSEFGKVTEVHLYRCEQTGLLFFRPMSITGSTNIYAALQSELWYYGADKWEHHRAIKDLARTNRVVEIGAGSGSFVRLARKAGLNVIGYEISQAAVNLAKLEGNNVSYGALHDLVLNEPEAFDGACCFQVLEHVPNPREFVEEIVKLVTPGGRILFSVPNEDSYLGDCDDPLNLPPHHMTRWTPKALASFGQFLGVRLIHLHQEPLAPYCVSAYLSTKRDRLKARPMLRRTLFNRLTFPAYKLVLHAGLRRLIRGHSMYALYEKNF